MAKPILIPVSDQQDYIRGCAQAEAVRAAGDKRPIVFDCTNIAMERWFDHFKGRPGLTLYVEGTRLWGEHRIQRQRP